jgi:hypothetical protein
MMKRQNQKGNVLFLILIAVALFAALSYAVTQSSRSGGDSGRETTILNSAQLAQYPNQIRTAVLRMNIDGTAVESVRFNTPANFGDLDAPRIGVFHPEGGGAVFQNANPDMMRAGGVNPTGAWTYNMDFEVPEIGISATGNAGNDLIAFLPGVTEAVCDRINQEAGIQETAGGEPPQSANLSATYALNMVDDGTTDYAITGNVELTATDPATALDGQPFGCFENVADSNNFVYYHVINER